MSKVKDNNLKENINVLENIFYLLKDKKKASPNTSYTAKLYQEGPEKINKKIMEEAFELTQAQVKKDITHEFCDLLYHCFVLLNHKNISFSDIEREMKRRTSMGGLEEKKSRKDK